LICSTKKEGGGTDGVFRLLAELGVNVEPLAEVPLKFDKDVFFDEELFAKRWAVELEDTEEEVVVEDDPYGVGVVALVGRGT